MAKRKVSKKAKPVVKKSEGLGDTVEKVLEATGIAKVAKFILGDDCGCDERKALLNKMYPYQKPNCLVETEYNYLTKYFKKYPEHKGTLRAADVRELYTIYNRVMNQKKVPSNCPSCVRNVLNALKSVVKTYEEE